MASACGVSWDGTSSGELDESAIPNDDFESHYLNAGDTKSDSSFPVVDGEGNLRAGNVDSAWDMRNQGDGVSEECLRKLDNAFDDNVLPDSAYENSDTMIIDSVDTDAAVHVSFSRPAERILGDGFNQHGVRENEDGSVDVRFKAMEPGVRKGAELTSDFLRRVSQADYSSDIPVQMDHSKSQMANVGVIQPEKMKFDDALYLQAHFPNTGSSVRDDVIADFTHDPPQIRDGSLSFDHETLEVEKPSKRGEPITFVDGKIKEFSLTPFPAGYDEGGITPEFSEAVEDAVFSDKGCGCGEKREASSQLRKKIHTLIKQNHD